MKDFLILHCSRSIPLHELTRGCSYIGLKKNGLGLIRTIELARRNNKRSPSAAKA